MALASTMPSRCLQCGRFQPRRQRAIVQCCELLHTKAGKQFGQVLASRFVPRRILRPGVRSNSKLSGHEVEKALAGLLFLTQHAARILEVAYLDRDAQAIVLAAMLPHECQIRFGHGVQANQFRLLFGNVKQFQALCGGQDFSGGAWLRSVAKTRVFRTSLTRSDTDGFLTSKRLITRPGICVPNTPAPVKIQDMRIGYARVSTDDQTLDLQKDALSRAKCRQVYEDQATGKPKSPAGRLVFHDFAALAEFERNLIRERTFAGLKAARAPGRKGGRPAKLSAKEIKTIRALLKTADIPVTEIAARFGIARSTRYRVVSSPAS